jgi:hypothetical protein
LLPAESRPADEAANDRFEAFGIRRRARHETLERFPCIDHDEIAASRRFDRVEPPFRQRAHKRAAMLLGGDDDDRLAADEAVTDEAGDGVAEEGFALVELNGVIMA